MERGTVEGVNRADYAAGRKWTDGDKTYEPGEIVDVSNLPPHKIEQFLRQRLLVPVAVRER